MKKLGVILVSLFSLFAYNTAAADVINLTVAPNSTLESEITVEFYQYGTTTYCQYKEDTRGALIETVEITKGKSNHTSKTQDGDLICIELKNGLTKNSQFYGPYQVKSGCAFDVGEIKPDRIGAWTHILIPGKECLPTTMQNGIAATYITIKVDRAIPDSAGDFIAPHVVVYEKGASLDCRINRGRLIADTYLEKNIVPELGPQNTTINLLEADQTSGQVYGEFCIEYTEQGAAPHYLGPFATKGADFDKGCKINFLAEPDADKIATAKNCTPEITGDVLINFKNANSWDFWVEFHDADTQSDSCLWGEHEWEEKNFTGAIKLNSGESVKDINVGKTGVGLCIFLERVNSPAQNMPHTQVYKKVADDTITICTMHNVLQGTDCSQVTGKP